MAIISGLSGAGKTAASKLLEDVGYRVIDNLPAELLRNLAQLVARDPCALRARGAGARRAHRRRRGSPSRRPRHALEPRGITPQVFFLEARDDVLIRRFSETRHRHPLDTDDASGVAASIARERDAAAPTSARRPT